MEVHAAAAPAVGKRLWSYVRAALFMARNGLSNKRKLLLGSMHLLKRRKAAVANLLSSHHATTAAYALRHRRRDYDYEYEFSCTNSPADPASSSSSSSSSRRRLAYFPCLSAVVAEEEHEYRYQLYDAEPALPVARIEHYASASASAAAASSPAPGEEEDMYACASSSSASPALLDLLPGGAASGEFSVRVSNYSSDDDEAAAGSQAVDADAEEFIRRFYDQLRRQNTVALLPYYMQQLEAAAIAAA